MNVIALALATTVGPGAAQDFDQVGAIFAERCVMCHSGENAPLGLRLDTLEGVLLGSETGPVVMAGNAASPLMQRPRGMVQPDGSVLAERFRDR